MQWTNGPKLWGESGPVTCQAGAFAPDVQKRGVFSVQGFQRLEVTGFSRVKPEARDFRSSVRWFIGSSVHRFIGSSIRRFVGSLGRWVVGFIGSLGRWVHRFIGSLGRWVHWFIGSLGRWVHRVVGSLVHRLLHLRARVKRRSTEM